MCWPKAPQAVTRDAGQETADTIRAQLEARTGTGRFADIGPLSDINEKYSPQDQQLEINLARQALFGYDGEPGLINLMREAQPELSAIDSLNRAAQQEGEISAIEKYGPRASAAIRAYDPRTTELYNSAYDYARAGQEAGAKLTPAQEREAQQAARVAMGARGLGFGPTDAFTEALYVGQRGIDLERQRQQFALGLAGQMNNWLGGPYESILGRQVTSSPASSIQQARGFNPGPAVDPYNPYFAQAYDFNANAQNAANIAGANQSAGLFGAGIGALGTVAGGALGGPLGASAGGFMGGLLRGRKQP